MPDEFDQLLQKHFETVQRHDARTAPGFEEILHRHGTVRHANRWQHTAVAAAAIFGLAVCTLAVILSMENERQLATEHRNEIAANRSMSPESAGIDFTAAIRSVDAYFNSIRSVDWSAESDYLLANYLDGPAFVSEEWNNE